MVEQKNVNRKTWRSPPPTNTFYMRKNSHRIPTELWQVLDD